MKKEVSDLVGIACGVVMAFLAMITINVLIFERGYNAFLGGWILPVMAVGGAIIGFLTFYLVRILIRK